MRADREHVCDKQVQVYWLCERSVKSAYTYDLGWHFDFKILILLGGQIAQLLYTAVIRHCQQSGLCRQPGCQSKI